ncbi:hypothetical protein BX600DRAFT_549836 [Xylariales sp. PMI_506]|nr:hypothetical protein BX600DRAFT_549836 [Xylariales sp. PMI_506]
MLSQAIRCGALMAAALAAPIMGANVPILERQGAGTPSVNASIPTKFLGQLKISDAGFAEVIPQAGTNTLFVSAFSLFGNYVYRINNIATVGEVGLNKLTATEIPGNIVWPNDITQAPASIFGKEGIVIAGGFLVPFETNGGIWYSANTGTTSGELTKIVSATGWWYHRVFFVDIDGDGTEEMVSCRADAPIIGKDETMLVVFKLKNPSDPTGEWVETEIGPGCDALFTIADLDGDGIPEIIAPSYFTETLNLFHSKTGFTSAADVQTITLDTTIGAAFDAQVVDINGDGKVDLLVSNQEGDGTGSVYAYEIPADITNAKAWTRHTLAKNFPVNQFGINQGAPGSPKAFYPTPAATKAAGAPYIALSGDASQNAYVLVPGATEWTYTTTILHDCDSTVGQLAVSDVDGDGYAEIIVPCYDKGYIVGYTFKP